MGKICYKKLDEDDILEILIEHFQNDEFSECLNAHGCLLGNPGKDLRFVAAFSKEEKPISEQTLAEIDKEKGFNGDHAFLKNNLSLQLVDNDAVLSMLSEKYALREEPVLSDEYRLFLAGSEKDRRYLILKTAVCSDGEIKNIRKFIDGLPEKQQKNAVFVLIAFVRNDFKNDDYFWFNGNTFLHVISCNLTDSTCKYDKNFHYSGDKKVKKIIADVERLFVGSLPR